MTLNERDVQFQARCRNPIKLLGLKMLKNVYSSKSEIPTGAETFYKEVDGKFALQVEGFPSQESVTKLETTLAEVRKEKRDALNDVKTLNSKYGALPEDFDINEFNRLKDADPAKELDVKLQEQRERMTSQFDAEKQALEEKIQSSDALVTKHVRDAQLMTAMTEVGVGKQFVPAVKAMFADKIIVEGENVLLNERPVSEAVKAWSETDEGKHFIAAPANSGGDTNNVKPNGNVKPENMTSVQKIASGLSKT